ncbi:pectinesterase family protein [Amnibacterium kyonggiense]|nr:pectinesterase family protein [Amnibacterium kyonggiense]
MLSASPAPARSRRPRLLVALVTAAVVASVAVPMQALAAPDTTAPGKPGSVASSYYGGVGTVLTWSRVSASDLATYRVYRSSQKAMTVANSTRIGETTSLSFTDRTATAGATLFYALTAVDRSGNESGFSSIKQVTAKDTAKPGTPSSLKATASASGIALDWKDNGEPDLAGYQVLRSTSSGGPWTQVASGLTASAFTDAQAPATVKSYYRVTASDLSGNTSSYASTSATRPSGAVVVPPAAQPPAAPTGFTAKLSSAGVPQLSWTAATGATSYRLSRAAGADADGVVLSSSITATTYSDGAAPAKQTAYYRLVAVNAAGASAAVTASVAVPGDTTPPATPGSPTTKVVPGGGMTVSWPANKEADLAGYTVQRRDADGVYRDWLPASGAAYALTSFTDDTAIEGTVHYYRLRAIDASGNLSGYKSITANNPNKAPGAPTSLVVKQDPTAGLALTWKAPSDVDLAGYSVYRSTSSSSGFALLTTLTTAAAGQTPGFRDTSAPKGVTVYYRVAAVDAVGNASSLSSTVSGTSLTNPVPVAVDTTVLTVGSGEQFATVAAAVASIPTNNLKHYRIDIDPGTYTEHFTIDSPFVELHGTGTGPNATVISAARASGSPDPAAPGDTLGTAGSAVVFVDANDVRLSNLTVANTFDEVGNPQIADQQAVALRVEGDRFVADHVRLLGNQDTLLADTPKPTTRIRQYYVDSYIEGDVDFVFGAANAVFDRVTFHALDRGKSNNGYLTAASTDIGSKYGFLIWNSKVESDAAKGTVNLGRPWHPSADPDAQGSVVFMHTSLPAAIDTVQPWDDMASTNSSGTKVNFPWTTGRFAEFDDFGPGATVSANRPQLTASNAAKITPEIQLAGKDGWNPVVADPGTAPDAPTGVVASTDTRLVNLTWNDDDSARVVGWNVYRADATGPFSKLGTTDTASYQDTTAVTGAAYRYVVTAITRQALESAQSPIVTVTVTAAAHTADYVVDPAATPGPTTFTTLAAALAAAPAGTPTDPTVIELAKGRYAEYTTIAKPWTIVRGATGDPKDVVITGDRAAGTPTGTTTNGVPDTYGTSGSATLVITGSNVGLRDLTVENAYKEGTYANGQAVALRSTGDRLSYDDVRLLGNQDTLYANSPSTTTTARTYIHDSYIEGDVDFVFGRGTVVIDDSTLHVLDHGTSPNGAVTAASTNTANPYGFLITDSRIIGDAPDGSQNLGRPWQPGIAQPDGSSVADTTAVAQVTVRDSWLGPVVSATAPWTNMVNSGTTTSWTSARFGSYANTGPGAGTGAGSPQLTDAQAADATPERYLAGADGWNPVADPAPQTAPSAPAGLTATGGDQQVSLTWNDNPEADAATYRVYRSTGSDAVTADAAHLVAEVAKHAYTDAGLVNGTEYHYLLVAVDTAGRSSAPSDAVSATAAVKPLVADVTVAKDGSGDFTTVQAALNAVPAGTAASPKVVLVKPGTYRGVVVSSKPNVIIAGTSGDAADVVITFDNANGTPTSATTCPQVTTATCGTAGSATVTLTGAGVQVRDLTIANTFDASQHPEIGNFNTQAVALRATGDRQVYRDVRLLGAQDTLNADASGGISADGSGYPRQYYVDSLIQGNVDYVFGRASAVFQRVTFSSTKRNGGTVFAPSTASKALGYLVVDSRFTSSNDPGSFYLGRPWRAWSDGAYADSSRGQTVIVDSSFAAGFAVAHPWTDFAPNLWTDGRFAEYRNTGDGATVNVNRPQLTDAQAAAITPAGWLAGSDGWNPLVDAPADTAPAAPTGLAVTAASKQAFVTWDESTAADVVAYRVLRDGAVVGTVDSPSFTDTGLTNDTAYRYTVVAVDAAGRVSAESAPVSVTPKLVVDAVVAADGSGDYTTLAAALTAAKAGWVIKVQPGTYTGTTTIGKPVTVIGGGNAPGDVVLTNGTADATVAITADGVSLSGLTLANTSTSGSAPALSMTGDQDLVANSVLTSAANRTVFADTVTYTASARQMITGSTIVGGSDIVLGRATLVINDSTIKPRQSGTVLTPSTASTFKGFLLINSTVDTTGVTNVQLGRPYRAWGDQYTPNSVGQAVVRDSVLGSGIRSAQPWGTGPANEPSTLGRFAEYANTGAGATTNANRPQLSPADSVSFTVSQWLGIGSWYPAVADPAPPADVTAPAAPTGLIATPADGSIALSWTAPSDADLAGYRVYRSTASTVALTAANLVGSPTSASFADTGLTNGTAYRYAVVALDAVGNASVAATTTASPADSNPPAAPKGLVATGGDSKVVLSWTASPEPDLAGYRVYDADGTRVTDALVTGTTYTVTGLTNGTASSFTLTAVDTAGNESAKSDPVTATPAPGDHTAPLAPTGVSTVLGKTSVTVKWAAVSADDLAGYDVYRNGTKLTSVGAGTTSYTDPSVTVGTTYAYTVTASDASGNVSAASSSASATPIKVDVVVAADGSGDATTLQAVLGTPTAGGAYDATAPGTLANNADYTSQGYRTILVMPGTYTGPFVSGNRYGVRIIGATGDPKDVVLTAPSGSVPTFSVSGNQWTFRAITLRSTYSVLGGGATALLINSGDKQIVDNTRILGDGRALYLNSANTSTFSRTYVTNSFIEGGSDSIYGRGVGVISKSTIHLLNEFNASIASSSISDQSKYGFLITDSTVTADGGANSMYLARPYGATGSTGHVVVRSTSLPGALNSAQPWRDASASFPWTSGRFFEYQNTGDGATVNANRPQLTADDQAGYTAAAYLAGSDGWNPIAN